MARNHATPLHSAFRAILGRRTAQFAVVALALHAPAYAIEKAWNTGTGSWGTQANWSPNGFVGFGDLARIGNLPAAENAMVTMDINATFSALNMQGQARLNTNGRQLVATNGVWLDGDS